MAYSTKAIFGKRALGLAFAEDYIDWAGEMLMLRLDSFHLRILAGLIRPGCIFETDQYFFRCIKELNIIQPEPEAAVRAYACEIAQQIIDGQLTSHEGVRSLYKICVATDYSQEYIVWYELDDALDSLLAGGVSYTYPSASLKNFDEIVEQEAENYIANLQKTNGGLTSACNGGR